MKHKTRRKLRLERETLRRLTATHLRRAVGGTTGTSSPLDANCDTIVDTQDSNCGCAGVTDTCNATLTDPGCGPSCELIPC